MTHWTVFDPSSGYAAGQFDHDVSIQEGTTVASAIQNAVQQERTVVLVLPAGGEQATVARITPPQRIR